MEVYKAIQTKRAIREYEDREISQEDALKIVNAGRRAQSAKNMQPWHFIVIQNKSTLLTISQLGEWAGHLAGAALGVAIITPPPKSRFSVMFDVGQAAAYMQLAAWEMGIGSCLATIYQTEKARQLLAFPDDLHIRVAISFGYASNPNLLSAQPKNGGRRSLEDVIHWERW